MVTKYIVDGLHICDMPDTATFDIVPLSGDTMGSWQKKQTKKPAACLNGSLYKGNYNHPIGTVIYGGAMTNNEGNGYGFGHVNGKAGFGNPWAQRWTDYITGYPGLIDGGKALTPSFSDPAVFNSKTRRSAVAWKPGHVYFIASVGGLTIKELQRKLLALGMQKAINLDGGGSSRLMVRGEAVNSPTDDRKITNMLVCYENEPEGAEETEEKEETEGDKPMEKIRVTANEKMEVYTAAGQKEQNRYIAKGDVCYITPTVNESLCIPCAYPTASGYRDSFVKDLTGFQLG